MYWEGLLRCRVGFCPFLLIVV